MKLTGRGVEAIDLNRLLGRSDSEVRGGKEFHLQVSVSKKFSNTVCNEMKDCLQFQTDVLQ